MTSVVTLTLAILAGLAFASRSVAAVPQQITFYTELGFEGDSITIHSHWSDNGGCHKILGNAKSYCSEGYWVLATEENFEGRSIAYGFSESRYCGNLPAFPFGSIRYLAAADTETPGITFYSQLDFLGSQLHFLGAAYNNFHFAPRSYATSGRSSWTFFTGPNFDGNATCIQAGVDNVKHMWRYIDEIQSIVRGCGKEATKNLTEFQQTDRPRTSDDDYANGA